MSRKGVTALLVLFSALTWACSQGTASEGVASEGGASEKEPAGKGADKVVAEGDGIRVTQAEVDRRAASRLARVRQEEYEARREALEEILAERTLEKEAAARGTTREELLKAEVEAKVPAPGAAEIEAVYQQNRARLGGRTKEDVTPDIERALRQQALAARTSAFGKDLQKKAGIRILLDPPRIEVPIPADAPSLGPSSAPVTIVEFSDYQCPYCRRAQPAIDQLLSHYGDKVRFVHRDFPLDNHPRAVPSARAARCAGEQDRFWEYHRDLLTAPGDLGDPDLKARAARVGLDAERFSTCLSSDRHENVVRQGLQDGFQASVSATPTFFINGRMVMGARPFEQLQEVVDAELAAGPR